MSSTPRVQVFEFEAADSSPALIIRLPRPEAWVVVLAGKPYVLGPGPVVVGRAPDCAIVVDDESVAARHAELTVEADGVRLRDHGSAQGTRVNGRTVEQQLLRGGERVEVGTLVFEVARVVLQYL